MAAKMTALAKAYVIVNWDDVGAIMDIVVSISFFSSFSQFEKCWLIRSICKWFT